MGRLLTRSRGRTPPNEPGPPPPDFQGSAKAHQTPRRPGRSASRSALSPSESIPGPSVLARDHPPPRPLRGEGEGDRRTVKEGREPSLGPPSMSLGSFTSPWCGSCETRTLPHPGPGISTWFPFAGGRDALQPPAPCEAGTERRASVPCQLREANPSCPEPTSPSGRIRWEPPRHR